MKLLTKIKDNKMSRLDRLKEQHPEMNISLIDMLAKVDPTSTYKYTEFLIKMTKHYFIDDDASDIGLNIAIDVLGSENVESLNEFEKHSKAGRIKNSDISSYRSWIQIQDSVKEAEDIVRMKELEKQVKKLYEDDEWLVVTPLSFEASKVYGMNTKWCTTQERHWNDYISNYKLIYILNKLTDEKYAVSRDKRNDSKIQAWLSNDNETSPFMIPIPTNIMEIITNEVRKKECVTDLTKKEEFNYQLTNRKDIMGLVSRYVNNNSYNSSYDDYLTWGENGDIRLDDIEGLVQKFKTYYQ